MKLRRTKGGGEQMRTPDARPGKWLRRFVILAILGAVGGFWYGFRASYLGADGLIVGDIVQVSSLASGRVLETYVDCNDTVTSGQPLARIENDQRALSYVTRLNDINRRSAEAEYNLDQLLLRIEEAAARLQEQQALVEERVANWEAHDRLFQQGIVTKVAWSRARAELKRAEAQVLTAETLLRNRQAEYDSAEELALSQTSSFGKELALLDDSKDLRGEITINAPRDGVVLECTTANGEVVLAGDTMFEIFDPSSALIQAFIDEADLAKITVGIVLEGELVGIPGRFRTQVVSIDPQYQALPEEFRRYFWQDPSWAKFATATLKIASGPVVQDHLRLGAKVSLTRVDLPPLLKRLRGMLLDEETEPKGVAS